MEIHQKTLTIEAGQWTPLTEALIEQALSTATLADVKAQPNSKLFEIRADGETVGAFVLRWDTFESGLREGVVEAAGGKGPDGMNLTAACMPIIEKMFGAVDSIRIHTSRLGMARKLAALAYDVDELVLRKKVNHGQQLQIAG